jgi:uncharacterized protein YcgI (DUF1989 family)
MSPTKQSGMLIGQKVDGKYVELTSGRLPLSLVKGGLIPACSGKGFAVSQGQVFRIIEVEGGQIADVWLMNRHNPHQHFMGHTTFLYEGAYPKRFTQFWSCMPEICPMATMLVEHSGNPELPENFHNHVVLGGHCTAVQWEQVSGKKNHNSCHENAIQAVKPFGLTEEHILHDNFMLFQPSFIRPDGSGDSVQSQASPGDYAQLVADMDLIVAVSACPVGDYSVPMSEPESVISRPLKYEIFDVDYNRSRT